MCVELKFLQWRQSLIVSKIAVSRHGHHTLSISAILIESLRQWPLSVCCFKVNTGASACVTHLTHVRPLTLVPPFNCHSFPSSIKYWEAQWLVHFHLQSVVDLSSMARIEFITSRNSGSWQKHSRKGPEVLSVDTCRTSFTRPMLASQSLLTVHSLPSPRFLGLPSHFRLIPSATTLSLPGTCLPSMMLESLRPKVN